MHSPFLERASERASEREEGLEPPTTNHNLLISTTTSSTKHPGAPNPSNPPHTNAPTAVETMQTLPLALFLRERFVEEFAGALAFRRWRAGALFVHDAPHCPDNPAVGLWCGHDGLDLRGGGGGGEARWGGRCGGGEAGGGTTGESGVLEAEAWGGVAGDLGATQDGFEGEADGEFQAGAEEGEEAPHGGVEYGVEREIGFQEVRGCGYDKVG